MTIKALYPNIRPSLDLNFARTKALDPRITFTRASTGTFVGSDGLIKTAANNAPRFDHDPFTGESLGLLIEEARTNTWTNSNSSASWGSLANTTIVSTSELAPDGSPTGFKVALNSGQNGDQSNARLTRFIDVTRANSSTLSLFVKFAGIDTVRLYHGDGVANMNDATGIQYTFSTNAVVGINGNTGGSYTVSAQKFANGWVRLSVNRPGLVPGPIRNQVSLTFTSAATGNGTDGVAVWGVDLQDGPVFPTSHIPTGPSFVTRAADVASITGANFSSWYNQSAGSYTFFSRGDKTLLMAFLEGLWGWNGGSGALLQTAGSNAIGSFFGGSITLSVNNANYFNIGGSVAVSYTSTLTILVKASQNASGNISPVDVGTITSWQLGSGAGSALNGTIARLTYYPTRLPDAQLQALTQ